MHNENKLQNDTIKMKVKNNLFYSGFCFAILLFVSLSSFAQTQIGQDINGEEDSDLSAVSVSMPDANTVGIGAFRNDGNGQHSGHVRVFTLNGNTWVQKGIDIDGENAMDQSGTDISMPDANTVAIAAESNNGNGASSGHVRIFTWSGSAWVQKGNDIDGEFLGDHSGSSISMPNSNTISIGARGNEGVGPVSGHARIFIWDDTAWVQKGNDIDGQDANSSFGSSITMPDENTVAVGASNTTSNGISAGRVRIYNWTGTSWVQKGNNLDGEAAYDGFGISISMPNDSTIAVGAHANDGAGINAGHVRVFSWNEVAWIQKGVDIEGEAAEDQSGSFVSMPNNNTIAIGAPFNAGNGNHSGHVRIYNWNGGLWFQQGSDIDGEAADDWSGNVSMPNATTVAIGARKNDGVWQNAGHVRIYSVENNASIPENHQGLMSIYPNPTDSYFIIDTGSDLENVQVSVKNALGQEIFNQSYSNQGKIQIDIQEGAGVYFVELHSNNYRTILKVIKK